LRLHQSDQSVTNGESAFRAAYVWRQKHHGGVRHSVAVERPVASEDAGARVASTDRKRAAEAGASLTRACSTPHCVRRTLVYQNFDVREGEEKTVTKAVACSNKPAPHDVFVRSERAILVCISARSVRRTISGTQCPRWRERSASHAASVQPLDTGARKWSSSTTCVTKRRWRGRWRRQGRFRRGWAHCLNALTDTRASMALRWSRTRRVSRA
jgi:hypothetical protein